MERSPTLPLSAFIAITVIIGGFFWIRGPLESKRPTPADRGNRESFGLEDVDARLWQDPFAAIHEYRELMRSGRGSDDKSDPTLAMLAGANTSPKDVLLLPVMAPGGDHADEVEMRRRIRRAVLAALSVADYVPEDADHVGYVVTEWVTTVGQDDGPRLVVREPDPVTRAGASDTMLPAAVDSAVVPARGSTPSMSGQTLSMTVPFEWFSREGLPRKGRTSDTTIDGHGRVLVLWLDEAIIGSRVVEMLDQIVDELTRESFNEFGEINIIGPVSSTTVLGLMKKNTAAYSGFVARAGVDRENTATSVLSLMDVYLDAGLPMDLLVDSRAKQDLVDDLAGVATGEQLADDVVEDGAKQIAEILGRSTVADAVDDLDKQWNASVAGLWQGAVLAVRDSTTRADLGAAADLLALASSNTRGGLPDSAWSAETVRSLAGLVSARFWPSPHTEYEAWLRERYSDLIDDEIEDIAADLVKLQAELNEIVAGVAQQHPRHGESDDDARVLMQIADAYYGSIASVYFEDYAPAQLADNVGRYGTQTAAVQSVADSLGPDGSWPDADAAGVVADALRSMTAKLPDLTDAIDWREHAAEHWRLAHTIADTIDTDTRIALHGALELWLWTPWMVENTAWLLESPQDETWSVEKLEVVAGLSPMPEYAAWVRSRVPTAVGQNAAWNWSIAGVWQNLRCNWQDEQESRATDYEPRHEMTFFSCRSTAAEPMLIDELRIGRSSKPFAEQFNDIVGAGFVRSVATDDALLETLGEELGRRGIKIGDRDVQIALIGEWDTFYGRALPRTFRSMVARAEAASGSGAGPSPSERTTARRVHEFNYLKGLDGVLPGVRDTKISAGSSGGGRSAATSTAFVSRPDDASWPFGRNQLDNIQRLAVGLGQLDRDLRRSNTRLLRTGRGIDVIGVVGSDIYDKLLILQALTSRFPDAVFFTTDLDAQMLHPTQQAWARNVIVISSYGLSLDDKHQRFTLPFRDSYQTATYVAALQAVNKMDRQIPFEPRIFEIGRQGLVDLSMPTEAIVHPPFEKIGGWFFRGWPLVGSLIVLAAFVAAFLLVQSVYPRLPKILNRDDPNRPAVTVRLVLGSTAILAAGFVVLHWTSVILWNRGGQEPLAAFGGVSAWPIQYWRWAAIVLSGFFFIFAKRALRTHVERVEIRFGLGEDAVREAATTGRTDLANTLNHWSDYVSKGAFGNRLMRVGRILAVFVAALVGLSLIFGLPSAYFRGVEIQRLHWVLLLVSGLSTAAVTIFVLDANLICWRNIVALAPEKSGWPHRVFHAFRERLGVPEGRREPVNQVLDLEIVADTTRVVGNLLQWPFLLLFMMILSRNTLHERWSLTPTLIYTYGGLFSLALISAIGLRIQAARARDYVLSNIRSWRCGVDPDGQPQTASKAMQAHGDEVTVGEEGESSTAADSSWIDSVTKHVESMDKGAFAPWYRHPIIQSVLLPASGLVLITVTELITRSSQ